MQCVSELSVEEDRCRRCNFRNKAVAFDEHSATLGPVAGRLDNRHNRHNRQ
jgi:hypothetical protein